MPAKGDYPARFPVIHRVEHFQRIRKRCRRPGETACEAVLLFVRRMILLHLADVGLSAAHLRYWGNSGHGVPT